MDIGKLFVHRDALASRSPMLFQAVQEDVGVPAPVLFLLNPDTLRTSDALTVTKLADVAFDLYVVYDSAGSVVCYVVDSKHPHLTRVYTNGMVIQQTAAVTPSKPTVKYSFDEFQVVCNESASVAVFCRSLATHQAT